MRAISSVQNLFFKRIFPVIWYGLLGMVIVRAFATGAWEAERMTVLAPALMLLGGYIFLLRRYVSVLADKVLDSGSFLLVRRGW